MDRSTVLRKATLEEDADPEPDEEEEDDSDEEGDDGDNAGDEPLPDGYIDLLARELPDAPPDRVNVDEMFADYAEEIRRRSQQSQRPTRRLTAAQADPILRNLRITEPRRQNASDHPDQTHGNKQA